MSIRHQAAPGQPLRGTSGATWLARLRRARYRTVPIAFLAVIGLVVQPTACGWCGIEANAAAHASRAGGSSRLPLLQRPADPIIAFAVTTGGHNHNAGCCGSVRLTDNTKPPPADFAALHPASLLPLPPPSVGPFDHPVGYVVHTAWYRPSDRIAPYCARSARLLL